MNAEVISRWIEALESGKYEQGGGALRYRSDSGRDSFCCLGVLCDLYGPECWGSQAEARPAGGAVRFWDGHEGTKTGMPPASVLGWAGVPDDFACDLANANDSGKPFADIAAMIRDWASTQGVRDE